MKKLLEVVEYSDTDIRFYTDVEIEKNPDFVIDVAPRIAFTMFTRLWGGNELSVLAMIRALAIADLAVSVNRKDLVEKLDKASADMARAFRDTEREMRKQGVQIQIFGPGVKPPKAKS